jgi:hypothetical protein
MLSVITWRATAEDNSERRTSFKSSPSIAQWSGRETGQDVAIRPDGGLTYTVNSIGDGGLVGPPTTCDDGTGNCTLRAAIQAANANSGDDVISFAITGTINLTQALPDLASNMAFNGPGARLLIIRRDTGGDYRVLNILNGVTINLSGLTVSGGVAALGTHGGGIYNAGLLTVTNCEISGNRATGSGGGIYNAPGSTAVVSHSLILGNIAPGYHSPSVTLLTGRGGGLANYGSMQVINSTLYGNSAYGQEYMVWQGGGEGGAIRNGPGSNLTVTNSTITGNNCISPPGTLNGFGGGIYSEFFPSTVNIKSTIIANNIALNMSNWDVRGAFSSQGFNIVGAIDGSSGFTASTDQTGTTSARLDPQLNTSGPQNNGGPTNTIMPLTGSPAIDKGSSAGLTGVLLTDQRGPGFPRRSDHPAIPNAVGGDGTDIGAIEVTAPVGPRADFDGDGKSDVSVFRNGIWYLQRSTAGFLGVEFGIASDAVTPGDYDGDGNADIAVYRTNYWYILKSSDYTALIVRWGTTGDLPRAADYDGDGKTDVAVYRPSANTFFVIRSSDLEYLIQIWGVAGDIPMTADLDGDRKSDFCTFRNGTWHTLRSSEGYVATSFGVSGDLLVPADYDGDNKDDIAVLRDGTWYLNRSTAGFIAIQFGIVTDTPVPGDYDGDGKDDVAVFRSSTGTWHILRSTSGYVATQFGASGDVAVPSGYIP